MPFQFNEETLLLITTPLYAAIIGTEMLASHWLKRNYYSWQETLLNVYLTLLNAGLDLLFRAIYLFGVLYWCYEHRLGGLTPGTWYYWVLLFIGEDFFFYLEHRVDHYCRVFWAVHVTHHSSEEYNLTTGFRSSVFQPLYRFVYFIPLALAGFRPADIVLMFSATQIYGILVHTQFIQKMPRWFEWVFVSPAHHRVHHASNIVYLDKNMGMCLIIWDRLLGTYQEELPEEPVRYGLTKPLDHPHHPVHIITHEWKAIGADLKRAPTWTAKLSYLLMPPGWSHDGSTQTSKELRDRLYAENKKPGY